MTKSRLALPLVLALAASAAQADIQPQSGLWKGDLYVMGERGCPSEIRQGLTDAFADKGYEAERLDFPQPFTPEGAVGDFKWTKTGENTWSASGKQSNTTPMGKVKIAFTHQLTVLSETQMDQRSTLSMTLPKQLAKMMGIGGACEVDSRVDHQRIGN